MCRVISLARPLSKGWPPSTVTVPMSEPSGEPTMKVTQKLNFVLDDIQPVVLPGNTLVGVLGVR